MKALTNLEYEGHPVRMVEIDGEPWWVLADVCRVLDIALPQRASARLDDDEKGVHIVNTLGGPQEMVVINESGMHHLVLLSRKPKAKEFRKWVTGTVLPSIREHGAYIEPGARVEAAMSAADLDALIDRKLADKIGQLQLGTRADLAMRVLEFTEPQVAGEGFRVCDALRRMVGGGKWPADVSRRAVAQKLTADLMRHFKITGNPVVVRGHERYFPRLTTIELVNQWWTELLEHGRRVANGQQGLGPKWPNQRRPINPEKEALAARTGKRKSKKAGDVSVH